MLQQATRIEDRHRASNGRLRHLDHCHNKVNFYYSKHERTTNKVLLPLTITHHTPRGFLASPKQSNRPASSQFVQFVRILPRREELGRGSCASGGTIITAEAAVVERNDDCPSFRKGLLKRPRPPIAQLRQCPRQQRHSLPPKRPCHSLPGMNTVPSTRQSPWNDAKEMPKDQSVHRRNAKLGTARAPSAPDRPRRVRVSSPGLPRRDMPSSPHEDDSWD